MYVVNGIVVNRLNGKSDLVTVIVRSFQYSDLVIVIVQADFVTKVGRFVTKVGRILQTTSKDFDFDTFAKREVLHKPSLVPREGESFCNDFQPSVKQVSIQNVQELFLQLGAEI